MYITSEFNFAKKWIQKLSSYFADFEQVKKTNKTPVVETGSYAFSVFFFLVSASCHQSSNINVVIRVILTLFFLHRDFTYKKQKKHKKDDKVEKA